MHKQFILLIAVINTLSAFMTLAAHADDQLCVYNPLFDPLRIDTLKGKKHLSGERIVKNEKDEFTLSGQAELIHNDKHLRAHEIRYDQQQDRIFAFGEVHLQEPDYLAIADHAEHDEKVQQTQLYQLSYQLRQNDAWGTADEAIIRHDKANIQLSKLRYTGCPIGQEDWWLTLDKLHIDDKTQLATGDEAVLTFRDIPVFYLPWFRFSTADRASGFLMPSIVSYRNESSTQNSVKSVLKIPYYFNIAPHLDDTITFMQMADRGQVLDNEFRYWYPKQKGDLTLSLLRDEVSQQERYRIWWNASQSLANDWAMNWSWHDVSDAAFYREIQLTDYYLRNQLYLSRHLSLNKGWSDQSLSFQLLDFKQMLYGQPYYSALPRIRYDWQANDSQNTAFYTRMGAEFSHFLQPEGRGQIPVGDRLHLTPSIGFDLWQPYGFLRGKSQLWLTHYALTNNIDNQLTRVVPVSSLDAGLLFEKSISLFDRAWVHTLEPRVKYLLAPKVDQSRYPVFDSMQRNFDYLQLFADNRFTGIDRIGDANQLTTGLFSRLLHEDGREFLELGLGQISYFQSRDVQLPGYSSEKGDFSDIIATASLALDQRWRASLTQQLDRDTKRLMQEDASVQYIGQQDNRFVVRHRLRYKGAPTEDEQYMVGGKLRHNGLWSSLHYVNYNNTVKQLRGAINAVQYDSCCWAGQLIWEHNIYINEVQDDIIRLAFIFKGLTTFGSTASEKVDSRLYFE